MHFIFLSILCSILIFNGCAKHTPSTSEAILLQNEKELNGLVMENPILVSGSTCQLTLKDEPVTLSQAKRLLQRSASKKGQAVLLHNCETLNNVAGCYRLIVCEGTAFTFPSTVS